MVYIGRLFKNVFIPLTRQFNQIPVRNAYCGIINALHLLLEMQEMLIQIMLTPKKMIEVHLLLTHSGRQASPPVGNGRKPCRPMPEALVILAQGAEEMETIIVVDMLRRAGITVKLAGLDGPSPVICSRQVIIVPDCGLNEALTAQPLYDAVILPGGLEGSDRLAKSDVVGRLLQKHEQKCKILAAICAAPTAFVQHHIAVNKCVTSYPTTKKKIPEDKYCYVEGERVVVHDNIVTSRGPGTAYWFGLKLIEMLVSPEKACEIEKQMVIVGY